MLKTIEEKQAEIITLNDERDFVEDAIADMELALAVINSVEITVRTPAKEVIIDLTDETKAAIIDLVKQDLTIRKTDLFARAQDLMK